MIENEYQLDTVNLAREADGAQVYEALISLEFKSDSSDRWTLTTDSNIELGLPESGWVIRTGEYTGSSHYSQDNAAAAAFIQRQVGRAVHRIATYLVDKKDILDQIDDVRDMKPYIRCAIYTNFRNPILSFEPADLLLLGQLNVGLCLEFIHGYDRQFPGASGTFYLENCEN